MKKIQAIVVGSSAGGIEAFQGVISELPEGFSIPIVVVQHVLPTHRSLLAELFRPKTHLQVAEIVDKQKIEPGTIYFAPPNYHVLIEKGRYFSLDSGEPVRYSRPSIDVTFKSASEVFLDSLVGILLTGANEDGADGLVEIKNRGGITVVQDPSTAEMPTMPLAAIKRKTPDFVLKIGEIALWIRKLQGDNPFGVR